MHVSLPDSTHVDLPHASAPPHCKFRLTEFPGTHTQGHMTAWSAGNVFGRFKLNENVASETQSLKISATLDPKVSVL